METPTVTRVLTFLAFLAVSAESSEKKVKMTDLPPAVQKAVQEHSQGATLVGLSREVENGVTLYEAELATGGRTKDVTFNPEGKVVVLEEETSLDRIPAAAREAITKAVGKRKLLTVEVVSEKGATFYEAHFRSGCVSGRSRWMRTENQFTEWHHPLDYWMFETGMIRLPSAPVLWSKTTTRI